MTTSAPIPGQILDRLKEAVGPEGFLSSPAEIAPHLIEPRGRYTGQTPLLLKPKSVAEVASIVTICNAGKIAIVPQGGNTGLVGGQIPDNSNAQILLSLSRLNRIRSIDPIANTITAEAGAILSNVQSEAIRVDRLFPVSLASEGSATIGGIVSTNAGGTAVLSLGNTRESVLGLEVVLPSGEIWDGLRALRKDNTGYDLKQLFIGAEGTLGIVTAAVFKIFQLPARTETAFVAVKSVRAALDLLNHMKNATGNLTAFELISEIALQFVLRHIPGTRNPLTAPSPWYVLLDVAQTHPSSSAQMLPALEDAMTKGIAADAAIASSDTQRNDFWRLRESISDAQKPEGSSVKHDVSLPIASIPEFLEEAGAAIAKHFPGARAVPFGHLGDGNIHYNISQPVNTESDAFLKSWQDINDVVHAIVHRHNGSISAEHGLGQAKVDEIRHFKSPLEIELMRSVKRALDPNGIMNPGKVLRT